MAEVRKRRGQNLFDTQLHASKEIQRDTMTNWTAAILAFTTMSVRSTFADTVSSKLMIHVSDFCARPRSGWVWREGLRPSRRGDTTVEHTKSDMLRY